MSPAGERRADVAAQGGRRADLRRADRTRGLGQRGDERGELASLHVRVGQAGPEDHLVALAAPAPQLGNAREAHDRPWPVAARVDGDHQVGAPGQDGRAGIVVQRAQRLGQRARNSQRGGHDA